MRDLDAIQADVNTVDREYVKILLSAYIDGLAIADADHPSVLLWREKLITKTDSVLLANEFRPQNVLNSIADVIDDPGPEVVDLLILVWHRLDNDSKSTSLPAEPVYMNVPVPGPYRSGIDPAEIDDPVVRAEYELAIEKNNQRADQLNRTMAVRQAYERFVRRASRVLREMSMEMSQVDRESLIMSRLRDSGLQGSEELLKELQSP